MRPQSRVGCGHLHLEYSSHFNGNAVLFRNFIVDIFNRPQLFMGGLSLDLLNSPPVAILPKEQQDQMVAIIKEFDQKDNPSIESFYKEINERVYIRSYINRKAAELEDFNKKQTKYHAVNFLHPETVEFRGLRPQKNAHQLLVLMRLFESRINQIKKITDLGQRIEYIPQDLTEFVSWSVERNAESYQIKIEPEIIAGVLEKFIADAEMPSNAVNDIMTDELKAKLSEAKDKREILPHGTLLGVTACGVAGYAANYSNYANMTPADFRNYENGLYTGIKWYFHCKFLIMIMIQAMR